ncbi:MAG: hypothetical protein ACLP5H_13655 [Desulfomonilaceae bacterium]
MRERQIQQLICFHPYLLDADLYGCGRTERTISSGRIDIDFETCTGIVVVECKITPLKNKDVLQLTRYMEGLTQDGNKVAKAYLVGSAPIKPLEPELLNTEPPIVVRELFGAIPMHLSYCRNGHYFSAGLGKCPYDGASRIHGKELVIV